MLTLRQNDLARDLLRLARKAIDSAGAGAGDATPAQQMADQHMQEAIRLLGRDGKRAQRRSKANDAAPAVEGTDAISAIVA